MQFPKPDFLYNLSEAQFEIAFLLFFFLLFFSSFLRMFPLTIMIKMYFCDKTTKSQDFIRSYHNGSTSRMVMTQHRNSTTLRLFLHCLLLVTVMWSVRRCNSFLHKRVTGAFKQSLRTWISNWDSRSGWVRVVVCRSLSASSRLGIWRWTASGRGYLFLEVLIAYLKWASTGDPEPFASRLINTDWEAGTSSGGD